MNKLKDINSKKTTIKDSKIKDHIIIILFIPLLIYSLWKLIIIIKKKIKHEKSLFFFQNKTELDYCHNFGLLVYDYNNSSNFYNLGDNIQSLAALQFLPKNCYPYLIDRELLRYYNGPKVNLIMNGWYEISEGNKIISDKIKPIYLSIHIYNPKNIDSKTIENFKKYEPIGCRDTSTLKILKDRGVKAYFSSCLTLTLDIDYAVNNFERTNEIIFVDFSFGKYPKIDKAIHSFNNYNFNKIIHLTHKQNKNVSHIERFKLAKKYLDKYARAKLVITNRLHVAFPCLALKTPVILVKTYIFDESRFSGLFGFLNTIGMNEKGELEVKVKLDENNNIVNPDKYIKYANELKKTLRNIDEK